MYDYYRAKCADCQIAHSRTSTTRKRRKKWRKLITCLHSPMPSIPLPSLFGHPAILASACFRSTLRFRPCGTGFAALSPADAGRSPRLARPALEDPRRSCRIANGSLVEASFVFARPEVIGVGPFNNEKRKKNRHQKNMRGSRCSTRPPTSFRGERLAVTPGGQVLLRDRLAHNEG